LTPGRYHAAPMRRIFKPLAVVAVIVVVGLVVSACGGSNAIPGNSVASVAGNPITTRAWKHWMFVAEKSNAAQSGSTQVIVPNDPPKFASCIKQVHQQIPSLKKTSTTTLRADCKQLFTSLNSAVMGFLITAYWYQADAHKLGYTVTDAQLNKAFEKAKTQQFKTAALYKSYLSETGQTNADIQFRVRVNTLFAKLVKRNMKKIDDAAIKTYYNKHKSQFGTPETRDLRIVRTKTQAQAQKALVALKSGQSFQVVAKKYSVDSATSQKGGLLTGVTKGQEEHAVDVVAFSSPVGQLHGPIHGTFGWYVIEVTKITPATQQSLAESTKTIRQLLKSTNSTAAQTAATNHAKAAFGAKTFCRATYAMTDCHGFKPPATTPATTPAGAATTPASTTPASTTPASTTGSTTPSSGSSTTPGTTTH
jgi:foldase protein PrsA